MMEQLIQVNAAENGLEGMLNLPESAKGVVLFAHGSGSGRFSPRNNFVAKVLQKANLGTLLIDLLTQEEDRVYENRFNIKLLTERLKTVVLWLKNNPSTAKLPIGLFGASTGAAAALEVAAVMHDEIKSVVSRGGRPDLAMNVLDQVKCPTLLIVGGNDYGVIELNQEVYDVLNGVKELKIVPHATHLFEEPGTLEEVAKMAQQWFTKYLVKR
jgi:putative phosphoribosyl transferase